MANPYLPLNRSAAAADRLEEQLVQAQMRCGSHSPRAAISFSHASQTHLLNGMSLFACTVLASHVLRLRPQPTREWQRFRRRSQLGSPTPLKSSAAQVLSRRGRQALQRPTGGAPRASSRGG